CGTPPNSARIGDEYVQSSATAFDRQTVAPVVLSRARSRPPSPPGARTTRSPATSGDQLYPQPRPLPVTGLTRPPNSLTRSFRHFSRPVSSRQTTAPWLPRA